VLCEVAVEGGSVQVRAPHPGPLEGDAVRLRAEAGVRFPASEGAGVPVAGER
jgi:hypothetical protein